MLTYHLNGLSKSLSSDMTVSGEFLRGPSLTGLGCQCPAVSFAAVSHLSVCCRRCCAAPAALAWLLPHYDCQSDGLVMQR